MFKKQWVQSIIYKLFKSGSYIRNRYVGYLVRRGTVPYGLLQGEVIAAMKATRPEGVLELIGTLRMRIKRIATGLWEDYGLVSTKLVTTDFAEYIVDSLLDSGTYPLDAFTWHDMGDDNTTESNAHTALQNSRETRVNDTSPAENTAQVYQSIATITATAGYDVEEHGIFSAISAGTMMDRNLVPSPPTVIASDQVEFTYELTVNAES